MRCGTGAQSGDDAWTFMPLTVLRSRTRSQDGAILSIGLAGHDHSSVAASPAPRTAHTPMHYVYVVRCRDGTYYTGYTTDVDRRVDEHNAGTGAKYTRGRLPVVLVHCERYDSQSAAMQREYAIKQLSRARKERLVRS